MWFLDDADDLVPGITGDLRGGNFTFDNVQVRSAHAARARDAHQYFTALRLRIATSAYSSGFVFNRGWRPQQACFHRATSALSQRIQCEAV